MNYLKSNRQSNDDDFEGREKSQFLKANRIRATLSFEAIYIQQIFMKFLRNRSKKIFKIARSTRANICDEIKMTSLRQIENFFDHWDRFDYKTTTCLTTQSVL